ncbi:hypothetical protein KCU95_g10073, partial [Aureobasidium melanogenum]
MRASDILLPIAAASIVAGSPLVFEERDANTFSSQNFYKNCDQNIETFNSFKTYRNDDCAQNNHFNQLCLIFKLIAIELELKNHARSVKSIFLQPILQPHCGTVDKQQSIVIKHDLGEIIKQHPINSNVIFQQHQKFDNEFIKQCPSYFILGGHHAKHGLFKQQPAHV